MAAATALVTRNEDWSRLALAIKEHGTNGLQQLLKRCPGLDTLFSDEAKFFIRLDKLHKGNELDEEKWKDLTHKCSQGTCSSPCQKKRKIILKELDISGLNVIFGILKTINTNQNARVSKEIEDFIKMFKGHVNTICRIRNKVFHFEDVNFEQTWNSINWALLGMEYSNINEFNELKTCSLDPNLLKQLFEITKEFFDQSKMDSQRLEKVEKIAKFLEGTVKELRSKIDANDDGTLIILQDELENLKTDITTKIKDLQKNMEQMKSKSYQKVK